MLSKFRCSFNPIEVMTLAVGFALLLLFAGAAFLGC